MSSEPSDVSEETAVSDVSDDSSISDTSCSWRALAAWASASRSAEIPSPEKQHRAIMETTLVDAMILSFVSLKPAVSPKNFIVLLYHGWQIWTKQGLFQRLSDSFIPLILFFHFLVNLCHILEKHKAQPAVYNKRTNDREGDVKVADDYIGKPRKKAKFGTTEHDVEKRRTKIYVICAIVLLICGVLDVFFLMNILG